jgi:hypothetical protein
VLVVPLQRILARQRDAVLLGRLEHLTGSTGVWGGAVGSGVSDLLCHCLGACASLAHLA